MTEKKRRRKSLAWGAGLLVIGACIGAAALYGTQWSLKATSTNEFCVSCHSMDVPYEEWKGTNHFANAKGIQAGCADCHIPHEGFAYLEKKMTSGISDVIAELSGGIPDADAYEEKRAEMAKKVWAEMEANDSRTCRSCHDAEHWDLYEQSPKAASEHRTMADSGDTCISCHRGIAHFPPDLGDEAKAASGELNQLAANLPKSPETLYPIRQHALFEHRDDSTPMARLLPSTPLDIIEQDGDWRQVRVNGYQPPDADRILYRHPGKRILSASIADAGQQRLSVEADDNDAGWERAQLTGWVKADAMVADAQAIWDYGEELNNAYCGSCHSVKGPKDYTANQWPSMVDAYADRTSISDNDKALLTFYLQTHASDMPKQEKH
ncbi:NapC/NirT family cytochrome c [Halomonas piscis]|uniref:Cytochrome c-type protein n=1 Tax=Halomonas piscis TaxID=3031727 RepID=A0ABY9Z119_9GAMM|nr:NapC/NirT family cytochrome c [Halomonas piscis]WNK20819.1 NapC/NirT family cytochrome c [Halomonas piscis]